MAECKDCFHYNACSTMYEAATGSKPTFITHNADRCNDFIPTADVVPRSEVARKIFEEIEREINDALKSNYKVLPIIEESEALWNRVGGKIDALRGIGGFIEELKEKYSEDKK